MVSRQERSNTGNDGPPIVDPREFLSKPFTRLEVGRLSVPPDIELLKWLPTLKDETGLVLQLPTWYVIKASEIGVPSYVMPKNSDTLLHSHPILPDEIEHDGSIPSLGDYYSCSSTAKEFISSFHGITQYWGIDDPYKRREIENALYRESMGRRLQKKEYLVFLHTVGARFTLYKWEHLNNERLQVLLR